MFITDFSAPAASADDYALDDCAADDFDVELSVKVVIVGDGAVGKSSLIQRYCRGVFTNGYKKTIGVDFLEKHIR